MPASIEETAHFANLVWRGHGVLQNVGHRYKIERATALEQGVEGSLVNRNVEVFLAPLRGVRVEFHSLGPITEFLEHLGKQSGSAADVQGAAARRHLTSNKLNIAPVLLSKGAFRASGFSQPQMIAAAVKNKEVLRCGRRFREVQSADRAPCQR